MTTRAYASIYDVHIYVPDAGFEALKLVHPDGEYTDTRCHGGVEAFRVGNGVPAGQVWLVYMRESTDVRRQAVRLRKGRQDPRD